MDLIDLPRILGKPRLRKKWPGKKIRTKQSAFNALENIRTENTDGTLEKKKIRLGANDPAPPFREQNPDSSGLELPPDSSGQASLPTEKEERRRLTASFPNLPSRQESLTPARTLLPRRPRFLTPHGDSGASRGLCAKVTPESRPCTLGE